MSSSSLPSFALFMILLFLNTFFPSASAASIKIRNTTPASICYGVEATLGSVATNAFCGTIMPGIVVPARTNITVTPTPDFDGAFTDFRNWTRGARHEMNFLPGRTWYNIDYEMGITNSTLGPLDGRNTTDNLPSLAGESNALAKANAAWLTTTRKPHLVAHYYYLEQPSPHSPSTTYNLTGLRMDKSAPVEVMYFLQMEANLTGYVYHGSVDDAVMRATELAKFVGAKAELGGEDEMKRMTRRADGMVWKVGTSDMVITAY